MSDGSVVVLTRSEASRRNGGERKGYEKKRATAEGEARDEGASAELSDMQRRGSSDAR